MQEAAKEAKREYMREWRKKNPEKVKANLERYWMKKAKEIQEKRSNENIICEE